MATDWELISKVKASPSREKVLVGLDGVQTPTQLAKQLGMDDSYTSRILKDLLDLKLIEALTPKAKRYKLFKRTKKGDDLLKDLKKV